MASIQKEPPFKEKDMKLFKKYCSKNHYVPIVIPTKKHVFAIGDLHGDYKLALDILINVIKVIDKDLNWILKDCIIVQTGDILDNCRPFDKKCDEPQENDSEYDDLNMAEDIKLYELFTDLDKKARKHNSQVISLFGNHELMNSSGNINYVSYSDVMKFATDKNQTYEQAKQNRIDQFKPGNKYALDMACTRTPTVIIGNFLFVHAGIVKPFLNKLNINNADDLYKVSYLVRQWLLNLIDNDNDNMIDIINMAPYSLFWSRAAANIRNGAKITDPECDENLKKVLDIFMVDSMVIGHTPQCFGNGNGHSGINSTCSGKLIKIDVGSSFAFKKAADAVNQQNPGINMHKLREPQVLYISYANNGDKDEDCVKVLKHNSTLKCDTLIEKQKLEKIKLMLKQVYDIQNKDELSYDYSLYRIFQMEGLNHLTKFLKITKNKDKLDKQNHLWKKVCYKCNWKFVL